MREGLEQKRKKNGSVKSKQNDRKGGMGEKERVSPAERQKKRHERRGMESKRRTDWE